ncbi:hypothetical protein [Streptomyces sp. NPDC049590]|uniref:hypothetical protein n=1 Tax=Streptomyces sp. NPDC049590 TaxID=3154834 RepID=UPI0034413551
MTTLDSAFLRHGRFDYVLPIGPADHTARTALWESYLARAGARADSAGLASASEGSTPADIAHAARTVSQAQFVALGRVGLLRQRHGATVSGRRGAAARRTGIGCHRDRPSFPRRAPTGPRGRSPDPPPARLGGGHQAPYREEDLSHAQAGQLGDPFGDVLLDPLADTGMSVG